MSNSPTPPAPQPLETLAAELAKRLRECNGCFGTGMIHDPNQAVGVFDSHTLDSSPFSKLRQVPCPYCRANRHAAALIDRQASRIDTLTAEVVRLTEKVAGLEHPTHRDTTEAAMRLRNWMRDYGSEKNPQFIDDLTAVLDENASIR
jgi:hypothetical protein